MRVVRVLRTSAAVCAVAVLPSGCGGSDADPSSTTVPPLTQTVEVIDPPPPSENRRP